MSNNPSSTTTPVACRLPKPVYAALAELAQQRGIKPGAAAAALISDGLAKKLQAQPKPSQKGRQAAVTAAGQTKPEKKAGRPKKDRQAAVTATGQAKPPARRSRKGRQAAVTAAKRTPIEPAKAQRLEEALDLLQFAAEVLVIGKSTKTGRFGDDRLFINHLWRQYKRELRPERMDLQAFKSHLVEANRERYLSLVCADMAPHLNQKDVRESEIQYGPARFHFLCV